ncbi:polyprenyl synthetase family protein [Leptospira koniambonensis]|uniref:Polyprenyl synthetase family protein n=1 Tax=Leptospira koniambonensis TaxID=2484950 RepID=A0A4V3JNS4_9LEPT|nr:polyprenyl synthetase family protein [Leptospira koniambonensis]TGL36593.1 polyprenyl synthetase family protein [Leptospira koniambonensis]
MPSLLTKPSNSSTASVQFKDPLDEIREGVLSEDLERFYELLEKVLSKQRQYLTKTEYSLYFSGKKVRPMMLLLSSRMVHGNSSSLPFKSIQGAVSLEMLHVATLIHDDIIDHAHIRRGNETVNAARGMEKAIILGDIQFVEAIRGFVDSIDAQEDMGLVKSVLDTAFRICCGELDELETNASLPFSELHKKYRETIDRKTAVLFGLSCESGVTLAGGKTSDARRAGFFGRRVGRAFQIMDDILDFVNDRKGSGKELGIDLSRRRLSLPIIFAMEELGSQSPLSQIIRGMEYTDKTLKEAVRSLRLSSALPLSYVEARKEIVDSLEYLRLFPDNRYKKSLTDIAFYVVNR